MYNDFEVELRDGSKTTRSEKLVVLCKHRGEYGFKPVSFVNTIDEARKAIRTHSNGEAGNDYTVKNQAGEVVNE